MKYYLSTLIFASFLLVSYAQNSACACCTDNHKAFSFWEGEWTVSQNGKKAGDNKLKFIQNGCVLEENWTSVSPGYTGTSHSFYNASKQQWEQLWIDNQGVSLHLKGHRKGNQMILKTDKAINKKGNSFVNRVTWTDNDDGTVRQLWEIITQTDDGEKISVAFDGLYKKVND
ncbi:MAG: hypothetical protein ED556_04780 [Winogradskyella sp.]|uniref:hypothetical protein n=1 Tax=Winogradskyella sp. TaxID=1883156 RepID=UPI000F40143D|nr:hypothetical protein [Winogradskyella sp.]RNC86738.1 MAG: hypothetical protein ED556_04780 [Winogradskyella sp.]